MDASPSCGDMSLIPYRYVETLSLRRNSATCGGPSFHFMMKEETTERFFHPPEGNCLLDAIPTILIAVHGMMFSEGFKLHDAATCPV